MNPWECPRCKRINAGWVPHCECKPAAAENDKDDVLSHCGKCGKFLNHGHTCTPPVFRCTTCGSLCPTNQYHSCKASIQLLVSQ